MAANAPPATNCYSAVLRRLLCSGSPPTHPSDDTKAVDHSFKPPAEENAKRPQVGSSINPGVVARLMGLDSFPNSPSFQQDRTLGSYFRSKSASSIDFVTQFDPVKQHRRVRTSVSFREGMYYHDRAGKVEEGITESGEKRNIKNERRGGSVNSAKLLEKNAVEKRSEGRVNERRPVTRKNNKKKKAKAKEEMTPTTKVSKRRQNKSFGSGCKVHPHVEPATDDPTKVEGGGVSPRRASPSKIGRPYSDNVEVRAVKKGKKGKRRMKKDNYKESCYYKRMVEVICGLTDESVSEKWIYEDFDEVSKDLGQEILQVLLKQFVDELVEVEPTLTMS